jgi:predicted DNA-binding transcriptional regulator AlpA
MPWPLGSHQHDRPDLSSPPDNPARRGPTSLCLTGGAVTDVSMPMTRTGEHPRATSEDTVALVRRLAAHYDDKTIAQILSKQHRRTATDLAWTKTRVRSLRVSKGIPAYTPPEAGNVGGGSEDSPVLTVPQAAAELGISKYTIYRWLREGFITGEQLTPEAPWRIRIDQALRDKIAPQAPPGWLPLDAAARTLGIARQTVLHKVQRGELAAVLVNRGQRQGLRIQVRHDQAGLFDTPNERKAQC